MPQPLSFLIIIHPAIYIPVKHDIALTDKINKAGQNLDIKLLDHVNVASEGYYSFADYGLVD
jgi:DNA repair protein RadC